MHRVCFLRPTTTGAFLGVRVQRAAHLGAAVAWGAFAALSGFATVTAVAATDVAATFVCGGATCMTAWVARRRLRRARTVQDVARVDNLARVLESASSEWSISRGDDVGLAATTTVVVDGDLAFVIRVVEAPHDGRDTEDARAAAACLGETFAARIGVVCVSCAHDVVEFADDVLVVSRGRLVQELTQTVTAYRRLRG